MPSDESLDERAPRRPYVVAAIGAAVIVVLTAIGFVTSRDDWRRAGGPIGVTGWAPYWQPEASLESFTTNDALFSDVSVVAYSATGATAISAYDGLPADMVPTFRAAAKDAGVPLLATVFDDSPRGAMAAVLANPATRAKHVEALVTLVTTAGTDALGYDGLDLDYETFAFSDPRSTWATTSVAWIAFLTELSAALQPLDKLLVVSVPPVYDGERTDRSGYWVYDYAAMAPLVDRIRMMTYDYSVASGEPGPVAPIRWVADTIDAVTKLVPPEKIDLGIPTYGYDWVVSITGTCPTDQTPKSKAIGTARAERTIAERGLTASWDDETAEMRFDYTDTLNGLDANGTATTCTVARTVRYLDARAIHDRAWLAHRNDLHGIALWALGNEDAATWVGINAARGGQRNWVPATSSAP